MNAFLRVVLRQAVAINIVFVGLVVVGALITLPRISVERYPNFNFGEVNINTGYPGATAEDVERLVTQRIEDALEGMSDLEFMRSSSSAGLSEVHVKFIDDTDYDALYDEVRFRVLGAQNLLPVFNGDPLRPIISLLETDEWLPVIQVNVVSRDAERERSDRSLTLIAEDLETILEAIDGVKDIVLIGEEHREVIVDLDPEKLLAHHIDFATVERAMRASWASLPAGDADTSVGVRTIRVDTRFRAVEDVVSTVLRRDGEGRFLRLGELVVPGGVRLQSQERRTISRVNGRSTVACKVLKDVDADARRIVERVRAACEQFLAAHAEAGVEIAYSLDSTVAIEDSMGVLRSSLILGLILVSAVLWVFVGWRNAVITIAGIPFAFLATIMVMEFLGYSLNELSLLAFVLVSGILVDDAVVVLENIHRLREEGRDLVEAVIDGTRQVFWPVVNSTLTTMAAFLPLLIMSGIVGEFFALIPKAVAIALVISLVEAMIILPVHIVELERAAGDRLSKRRGGTAAKRSPIDLLTRFYDWALNFNLRHKILALLLTGLLFAGACAVIWQSFTAPQRGEQPVLEIKFFPDETTLLLGIVRLPGSAPIERTDAVLRDIALDLVELGPQVISSATAIAGLYVDRTYRPVWAQAYGYLQIELPAQDTREFAGTVAALEAKLLDACGGGAELPPEGQRLVLLEDRCRALGGAIEDQRKRARADLVALEAEIRELTSALHEAQARVAYLAGQAASSGRAASGTGTGVNGSGQSRQQIEATGTVAALQGQLEALQQRLPAETTSSKSRLAAIDATELDRLRAERDAVAAELLAACDGDTGRAELTRRMADYQLQVATSRPDTDPLRLLPLLTMDLERRYERDGVDLELSAAQGGPPTGSDVNIRIAGQDKDSVFAAADDLMAWMKAESASRNLLPGVINLSDDRGRPREVLSYHVQPAGVAEHGLQIADVVSYIAGASSGSYVGEFRATDEDLPLRVRIAGADQDATGLLSSVITEMGEGRRVLLSDVATIERGSETSFLNRWNFRRSVIIQGGLEESSPLNPRAVAAIVKGWFDARSDRYPGVTLAFGGWPRAPRAATAAWPRRSSSPSSSST